MITLMVQHIVMIMIILYQETEKCGVPGKYGVKWSECIYTEIHQKWSPDISFDRSH